MCIICTGKIYKQNLNTLTELSVSYCLNLTSEKLQEILIRCKNLEKLYCNDCISLTSLDLRNNKNLTTLGCSYCKSLTSLDLLNNINLKELDCHYCKSLTSLDLWSSSEEVTSFGCVNLEMLYCYSCTSLTSLDLRNNINLMTLWCYGCSSLTSLDLRKNKNLQNLHCYACSSLTSLDLRKNKNLQNLLCSSCKSLINLKLPKEYKGYINRYDCPWIIQNKKFSSNLQRLIKIQKWYRKLVIIKYMKSQEFIEWVYSPTNIGGRLYKKWLLKNLK